MAADRTLERYAWLSLAAALATIALKTLAWYVTGSVGLLSDALEALINLAAALLMLSMLRLAAAPPDDAHPYGRFEEIEERIRSLVPKAITLSHIEPISQPASYDDIKLERW